MKFYIHALSISERIFHVGRQECLQYGCTLEREQLVEGHTLMSLDCSLRWQLDSLIATFFTDRSFELKKIYDEKGMPVERQLVPRKQINMDHLLQAKPLGQSWRLERL